LPCAGDCEAGLGLVDFFESFFSTVVALASAFALPFPFCAFSPFADTGVPPELVFTEGPGTP